MRKTIFIISFFFLLSESVFSGGDNISPKADITASTTLSEKYAAQNVADGVIRLSSKGEWACLGDTTDWGYIRLPWIQLKWELPQYVNKIVIFDRPSLKEHIAACKLTFSDGTTLWLNEIQNDGAARVTHFPTKHITWIKIEVTDAKGRDIGFSEVEVYAAPEQQTDYVSWVDSYIETNRGRYFFFATGCRPFGMISAAPFNRNKNQYGGGYNYNENEILSFNQIHDWMISGIDVMPAPSAIDPRGGHKNWKSKYTHAEEIVQPGYHRLYLEDHHLWTELTSTDRVSFYRFTFTQDMMAQIIVSLNGHVSNSTMKNAEVRKISDAKFEGSFSSTNRYWGGPKDIKIFFVVEFDKPFLSLKGWNGNKQLADIQTISGDSAGVAPAYSVRAGDVVQMKIAISYTSIANALNNLQTESKHWNFDDVRNDSRKIWNEWLGKIKVEGGTTNQKIKFYTDLWHVLLGRHKINDVSGDYPDRTEGKLEGTFTDAVFKIKTIPSGADGKPRFNMYNSDAFWLTQWNLNILWGLAWPSVQDDISASMIQYADNGYLLPRGPTGGGYTYIMTGCPTSELIISTYMKNLLTKADARHAFEIIKQNHLPGGMLGKAEDIKFYTQKGWWPDNAGITIEATFQDWSIAQMAQRLGMKKEYNFFIKRSEGWKKCFDPAVKLLLPKDRGGNFIHKDPLSGQGWVEANAWQATFGVSHAIPELAKMMGGYDTLSNKLNFAFEQSAASDFVFAYTSGYVSYANQPGCSNAHVFSHAGKPWLTQYWVRRVKEQAYGGVTPDLGYGGHDEDQGQMGGVSALMAIGLFSLNGNTSTEPTYEITSPIFDKITITLDPKYYKGKEFVITVHNNSQQNMYIQKATLNGQPHNSFWFTHTDFAKGGTLDLWLGPQPNKEWGL